MARKLLILASREPIPDRLLVNAYESADALTAIKSPISSPLTLDSGIALKCAPTGHSANIGGSGGRNTARKCASGRT